MAPHTFSITLNSEKMRLLGKVLEEGGCDEKIPVFKAYEGRRQSDRCCEEVYCSKVAQKGSGWCHFIRSRGMTGLCYS